MSVIMLSITLLCLNNKLHSKDAHVGLYAQEVINTKGVYCMCTVESIW